MHYETPEHSLSFRPTSFPVPSVPALTVPQTPVAITMPQLKIELFPINPAKIPPLVAYVLDVHGGEPTELGARLACRCNDMFPGCWLWTEHRLVTNHAVTEAQFQQLLSSLWKSMPTTFGCIHAIQQDSTFQVSAQVQADFVAHYLSTKAKVRKHMLHSLANYHQKLSEYLTIRRICTPRGWVVDGRPALALSMTSEIVVNQNLRAYARQLADPEQLKGLLVLDRNRKCKGQIVDVYKDRASAHRERLLNLTLNHVTRTLIEKAEDDELVVQMRPGKALADNQAKKPLDYVASALQVVARVEDASQFGVKTQALLQRLRLSPEDRSQMISAVAAVLRRIELIQPAFTSEKHTSSFLRPADYDFVPHVLVGGNHLVKEETMVLAQLRRYGFYQRSAAFPEGTPIRVGLLLGVPDHRLQIRAFLNNLQKECQVFKFPLRFVGHASLELFTRVALERAIGYLKEQQPDIILALLPERVREQIELSRDEGYLSVKDVTVVRGIPNQVVYAATLSKTDAVPNIALGLLCKVGNVPFRLAEPLQYTDVVVGIDIARMNKARLAGSMNTLATTHIYQNSEPALKYAVHQVLIEGETIPEQTLQQFFPAEQFAGLRVLVHRDGWFRGNERAALKAWGQQIGATFFLVEVVKSGAPRLYHWMPVSDGQQKGQQQPCQWLQPAKGSAFRLSDQAAFLVSSLPPFKKATPYPLYIRAEAPLSIEHALHSVLSLTLLHYGSLLAPRLPVTTHYSDKMASLALRGIRPPTAEGTDPYWI
ncbi:hypothetical protein KSF_046930 [Reticulibacter mediterranei]|uniref:Protein argonaute n=1 Tax=Reticulibacter mediterranei TaxID=2778369 RepID=A0A8J3N3W7_9CHLR|nr:Piwi domain-containing protein [Reticulibacter mediterranei]GHO94645.1 hypothetical protein KSF_046930 [Reticulibacter mediterranei]